MACTTAQKDIYKFYDKPKAFLAAAVTRTCRLKNILLTPWICTASMTVTLRIHLHRWSHEPQLLAHSRSWYSKVFLFYSMDDTTIRKKQIRVDSNHHSLRSKWDLSALSISELMDLLIYINVQPSSLLLLNLSPAHAPAYYYCTCIVEENIKAGYFDIYVKIRSFGVWGGGLLFCKSEVPTSKSITIWNRNHNQMQKPILLYRKEQYVACGNRYFFW